MPPVVTNIPDSMLGVLLMGHGGPDQLVVRDDLPVPRPRPDEVLVEVAGRPLPPGRGAGGGT